jgi:hypothetical protein
LRIFLTYRRDDSAGHTGRIADRLKREFGEDSLFMDVDAIPLGVDFRKRINDEVARCDVLIAAIGNRWMTDDTSQRRIDNPLDPVRIEISAALQRDIPLIPILSDGTKIPNAQLLPDDVKGLADRNGLNVRHETFHSDLDRLVRELRQISHREEVNVEPSTKSIADRISSSVTWQRIAGGVTILGVIAVVALLPHRSPVTLQPAPAAKSSPEPTTFLPDEATVALTNFLDPGRTGKWDTSRVKEIEPLLNKITDPLTGQPIQIRHLPLVLTGKEYATERDVLVKTLRANGAILDLNSPQATHPQ